MYATFPSLAGKRVVVTGGATGIGAAIAEQFAGQGARVSIFDLDEKSGNALAARDRDHLRFMRVDVTDTAALSEAIDAAAAWASGLDVLIANAGNDVRHTIEQLTPELWDDCLAVNLKHQFFAAKAAYPHLKKSRGTVICLGSISWMNETVTMPAYTTAKAGVHGLVRTLARLWGEDGIRVNALLPGWTMTERQRRLWVDEEAEAEIRAKQCLDAKVMPGDIARAALFLASADAAMITKQAIVVDGGWL